MQILRKKIGIWGYGVFGKSAINYFASQGYDLDLMDQRILSDEEKQTLHTHNIQLYTSDTINEFLRNNSQIIASPGVDLTPYTQQPNTWLQELDVFYTEFKKPIIAITGSIGKTTITHILSKLLSNAGKQVVTGGNIGTPMFDLIDSHTTADLAVLEVSSFQLEHCTQFAPQLAILTNIFPNHLDRHKTMDNYCAAKHRIFANQHPSQQALMPLALKNSMPTKSNTHYFSAIQPTQHDMDTLASLYFITDETIYKASHGTITPLIKKAELPHCTFVENWLILCAALDILQIPLSVIAQTELDVPEHRLEKVATINGITYYNDSKSTTPQSTLAAVRALSTLPVFLLLGGLSKGVNRKALVQELAGHVKALYCFGAEAQQLAAWGAEYGIPTKHFPTLADAFVHAQTELSSGDQLLLSPAGSSYDLYKDYKERGAHFKQLIATLKH